MFKLPGTFPVYHRIPKAILYFMKKLTTLILLAFAIFELQNAVAQVTDPILTRPDVRQYGHPFTGVPDRRDVSIYQVNIRSFSNTGDFKGVTERLDSIKALGVNVLYLMPIYPVGILKSTNSPYCVRDYRGINPDFGTLDDLRNLVAGAHKRGMAVMLDWVANHTSWDNPWMKNKGWYLTDAAGNVVSPPGFNWYDVAQLNFKNADMRTAMIKSMKYWVLTANVDGFRCDYADGPPSDFWVQAIDTLRNVKGHRLLFLAEGNRKDLFPDGFDYNFGFKFYGNLRQVYRRGKTVHAIDSINKVEYQYASNGQQMVRYLTNHDVNSSDGTPLDLFGGERGSMAAFVVVAYMEGVPFIYNGQEVGMRTRLVFPFTKTKIDWTPNPHVTGEYKSIIAFRNHSNAIRRGQLTSFSSADVCAFLKTAGSEKVLVLSNLRNKQVSFSLPQNLTGSKWKNVFTNQKSTLGNTVDLPPYSYLVFKN